jgi:hypothetical protein
MQLLPQSRRNGSSSAGPSVAPLGTDGALTRGNLPAMNRSGGDLSPSAELRGTTVQPVGPGMAGGQSPGSTGLCVFCGRSMDAAAGSLPRRCRGIFPLWERAVGARQTPQRPASENVHEPSSNPFTTDCGRQGRHQRALGPSAACIAAQLPTPSARSEAMAKPAILVVADRPP